MFLGVDILYRAEASCLGTSCRDDRRLPYGRRWIGWSCLSRRRYLLRSDTCFGRGFLAATMREPVMVAGCAGRLRSVAASLMTGVDGFGCFALTIRCGIGGDCFRLRARFGR